MLLRGGFIGFGRMGITHFSILNTHPSVQITAICDSSNTMLKILQKYVNIGIYSNYEEMIEEESLDFVVISTPSDSHAEIVKFALANNLHTFVEKPFALKPAEGQEILKRLAAKNLVNQVGYVNRFNEVFTEVKQLLQNGTIGEVKSFSSEMYGPTVLKDSKTGWRGRQNTGGGCMLEYGSHCIDLVIYLLGQPDRVVGSVMQSIYSSSVEDLVISNFIYEDGYSGSITVNWSDETFRTPTNIVKIFGTKGKIIADKHAYKLFLKHEDKTNGFRRGWNTRYITDFAKSVRFYVRGNEFTRELDYFVDCIQMKETENISSFAEAHKTDVVMEQILRDAHQGKNEADKSPETVPILANYPMQSSLWRRLFGCFVRGPNA